MFKGRRKAGNVVIDPGALFRLSLPFIVLVMISAAIIVAMDTLVLNALKEAAAGDANAALIAPLNELVSKIFLVAVVGLTTLGSVCIFFWFVVSHRIFGPTIPFRRHIQSLIDGDYTVRVQLRKRDEFQDLAEALNQLTNKLQERQNI